MVNSMMKLFADDSKIFKTIEPADDISLIQEDLNKLLEWSNTWQLPLNVGKCKVIHYKKDNPNHSYQMGDSDLTQDVTEKDVGVTFDPSLEFRLHIANMINKANSRVGMIRRSFSYLEANNFNTLYKSLVRPILEYCSSVWYPLYKTDINEIEKVQHRATKSVPSIKHLPYPDRLRELNLTTLSYRRQRTDMLQVYRIIHKIDKNDFNLFFEYNTAPTRGHKWKLDKPRATTRIRLNSFAHRVINPWNALPEHVVQSPSINAFKNALEKAWANKADKYEET